VLIAQNSKMAVAMVMRLKTRIFELCNGRYRNLSELAEVMGILPSQIYWVKRGALHR